MKNVTGTDVGTQYEDLALLLSQLNADAPKIQMLYKELRNNTDAQNKRVVQATTELNELSEITLQAIQEERESAIDLFKQYQATAEQALHEAEELQNQLNSFSELVEKTDTVMRTIDIRLDKLEKKIDALTQSRGSFVDAGPSKSPHKASAARKVVIDYDEVTTAKALYDKYHGKIDGPLIIQRINWFGDYAFVVDELYRNGTWVRGVAYVDGQFRRNTSYHADTEEFRMYNGPSVAKIIENHSDSNLPF